MFQLVHHADIAQAIELAGRDDDAHGIYNVAEDERLRVHDVQRLLRRTAYCGRPTLIVDDLLQEGRSEWARFMNATRIRATRVFPSISLTARRDDGTLRAQRVEEERRLIL